MKRYMIFLIILLVSFSSCKKKEDNRGETKVNPYTTDSIFEEVKKNLEKDPKNIDELYHLADLYERSDMYNEAIDVYTRIVAIKPDAGYAFFKKGTILSRINRYDEAIISLRRAVKLMPENAVAYNNLAVAYGKAGNLNEEISNLKKALKLRPNYATARYNLGIAYLKKGEKGLAMKEYNILKTLDEGVANNLLKEIKKEKKE